MYLAKQFFFRTEVFSRILGSRLDLNEFKSLGRFPCDYHCKTDFFFPLQLLDSLAFHIEVEVERKDKKTNT